MQENEKKGILEFLGSARAGLIAHVPPLVLLATLALAHVLLIGPEHEQVALTYGIIIATLGKAMPVFLVGALIIGAIRFVLTPSRERSLGRSLGWLIALPWAEILLLRLPLAFGFTLLLGYLHLSFKVNIASFAPYAWDQFFAGVDRALFLGSDPWTITHGLMPDVLATMILDMFYMLWFLVMQLCITAAALLPLRSRLRLTFLTAYGLNWTIAGVGLAILFASGGPVYMEGMTGDATFRPLVDRLHEQGQVARIMAIEAQRMLWEGYVNPDASPVGISAFPSLHIAISVTCACLGFAVSRVLGAVLAVFAAGIFVGSVHLGWHYAVDGIFSAPMALLFWFAAARIARWWLARTAPADLATNAPGAFRFGDQQSAGLAKNRLSTSR